METRNLYKYQIINIREHTNILSGYCPEYDNERPEDSPSKGKDITTSPIINITLDKNGSYLLASTLNSIYILHECSYSKDSS